MPMISTTEPSGRFVTLPAFGRFTGSARGLPVTMPSSSGRDELARRHARHVGRVAHRLVVLDVVDGVGAVAFHAVVVHAPAAAVVVAGMHEAGHELDRVVIAGTGEHAEPAEDLEAHRGCSRSRRASTSARRGETFVHFISGGGSIQMVSFAARSGSSISALQLARTRLRR